MRLFKLFFAVCLLLALSVSSAVSDTSPFFQAGWGADQDKVKTLYTFPPAKEGFMASGWYMLEYHDVPVLQFPAKLTYYFNPQNQLDMVNIEMLLERVDALDFRLFIKDVETKLSYAQPPLQHAYFVKNIATGVWRYRANWYSCKDFGYMTAKLVEDPYLPSFGYVEASFYPNTDEKYRHRFRQFIQNQAESYLDLANHAADLNE